MPSLKTILKMAPFYSVIRFLWAKKTVKMEDLVDKFNTIKEKTFYHSIGQWEKSGYINKLKLINNNNAYIIIKITEKFESLIENLEKALTLPDLKNHFSRQELKIM